MKEKLAEDWGFWPRQRWQRRQADRQLRQLRYLAEHSPYYREHLTGIELPTDTDALAEIWNELPLTGKEDLARVNQDFLVAASTPVDCCLTSGTTGLPVSLWQNENDLQRLGLNESLALGMSGIAMGERVLIGAALDRCFMAGLAYFLGLKRISAEAIRAGAAPPPLVADLVTRQRPSSLIGVPSLLRQVGELLQKQAPEALAGVRRLVCVGEPIRTADLALSELGCQLRELWGAPVLSTYASTELATSFCECAYGCGGHLLPQLAHLELLDAEGQPVSAGEVGEVVVTPLGVEATPLLRYQTGDLAVLFAENCPCGRTTPRLGPILGRRAQMLKVRGTTLFPQAIFAVVQAFPGVREYCLEVEADFDLSDRLRLLVAGEGADLEQRLSEHIQARTRIAIQVERRPLEQLRAQVMPPQKRKPVRFIDRR